MTKLHVQFHRSLTPAEFDADGALSEALAIRDEGKVSPDSQASNTCRARDAGSAACAEASSRRPVTLTSRVESS